MPERRFPPPWTVEDIGTAFVVIDSGGREASANRRARFLRLRG